MYKASHMGLWFTSLGAHPMPRTMHREHPPPNNTHTRRRRHVKFASVCIFFWQGRVQEAIACYEHVSLLQAESPEAHANLASAYKVRPGPPIPLSTQVTTILLPVHNRLHPSTATCKLYDTACVLRLELRGSGGVCSFQRASNIERSLSRVKKQV